MNQLQELRISTANLLQQLNILLHSLNNYMMSAKECQYNQKELALQVEEYLQMGVGALEIFTRYVRNINLQTLQTPNYDLQTNVCVEKVLLAYSHFCVRL